MLEVTLIFDEKIAPGPPLMHAGPAIAMVPDE